MKRISIVALLVLLCILITACGGSSTNHSNIAMQTPHPTSNPITPAPVQSSAPIATATPTSTPVPTPTPIPTPTPTLTPVAPVITKQPTAENTTEGGTVVFIARADSYDTVNWQLISPDGNQVINGQDIAVNYPRVSVEGINGETLKLHYVPATLNGWKVRAVFSRNGNNTISDTAALNIAGFFTQIPHSYCFSSGVGAWSTELTVNNDGTFSGEYHDWEATSSMDSDPTHSDRYYCQFSGQFANPRKIDGYTYSVDLISLNYTKDNPYFSAAENMWYIPSDPYGLTGGTSFTVVLPGIPTSSLSESFRMWAHMFNGEAAFNGYAIYNNSTGDAFIAY